MSILDEFTQAGNLPNTWIKNWKNEGKKVLGYFCTYIPDEIIYAADILPIRLRVKNCTDTPMGDAYMTETACSFTRCCLEAASKDQFQFLDGVVSCNTCDQIRRLYDNLKFKTPFPYHYFLNVPANINEITIDWFKHELEKFKENLEKHYGTNLTDEKIKQAIRTYNYTRTLLRDLYTLRKREDPPISGTDIMKIITAGVSIPRDQFNDLLNQQLKIFNDNEGISDYRARLMIIGSLIDNSDYMRVIEDLGGLIVTDSLCYGTRYFWDLIDETVPPLEALAQRYMSKISCPRMTDGHPDRKQYILDLIKEYYVDGVIFQRMKFCPLWWGEIFMLRQELKDLEVPFIDLEREYVLGGVGQMKTRIQAFLEVLEHG